MAISQQISFLGRNINAINYIDANVDSNKLVFGTSLNHYWPAPTIRYFPGDAGRTILVCDFPGIYWSRSEQLIRPKNSEIERIHLGQLQISPPVFRISFTSPKRTSLAKIDLTASQGQLTIKLPASESNYSKVPGTAHAPVKSAPNTKISVLNEIPPSAPKPIKPLATVLPITTKKVVPPVTSKVEKTEKKIEKTENNTNEMPPFAPSYKKPMEVVTGEAVSIVEKATSNTIKVSISYEPFKVSIVSTLPLKTKTLLLSEPDRFVIDFEDTNSLNSLPPLTIDENPYLKSIRFGSVDNMGRMVLDLKDQAININTDFNQDKTCLVIALANSNVEKISTKQIPKNCSIVLDAGHGGTDPGAQRGSIQEKELTLAIALKTKKILEKNGIKVTMTRSDDSTVALADRVQITNTNTPDLFLSVHINSMETNNSISGIETYYFNDVSKGLAKHIHAALVNKLSASDRSVRKARFYVINHTPHPAVLAEVGFISNKEERDKLISPDYQKQIAEALSEGVILHLGEGSKDKDK
jgi:N-acetylmuramoyl-L-alanine amidase